MMQIIANGIFCKILANLFTLCGYILLLKGFPCAKGDYDERFLCKGVSAEGLLCSSVLVKLYAESVF